MENIVWDEKLNIGVDMVDKAHAKLFRIFNKLLDISKETYAPISTYKEGIKYLETYSMAHFTEEEAYMRSIRYKEYSFHKKIHDNFRDKTLVALKKDLELSGYSPLAVQRFVETLSTWLSEHIMREDQAIVGKAVSKRSNDLSSQIGILSRAVNRATMEAFQVEATLVTSEYKGQNIGNAYYCHQDYTTQGGIKLQMLSGAEEPLMLRGVSRMLEMKTIRKEELNHDTALQIFKQLFEHMSKVFRAEAESEFEKENLFTKDDFRKDFMKGYPVSLLFSTKLGYFIFCYRSLRVKKQNVRTSPQKA